MTETASWEISQTQKERLKFIDFRLNFFGVLARSDLEKRFGIKAAATTRDITLYRQHKESNLDYDAKSKVYRRSNNFVPLFNHSTDTVLLALCEEGGIGIFSNQGFSSHCEQPFFLNKPDTSILAELSRAIYLNKVIHTGYASTTSGITERDIVPLALVNTGHRWHVRAYDRKEDRQHFSDFVLTRFSNPQIIDGAVQPHEELSNDIQWNRVVEMEIVPHPHLEHKECVMMDYSIPASGVLEVKMRAALAGYFLRYWNIDCTDDYSLRDKDGSSGQEYQLWLKEPSQTLHKVRTAKLAPGF